MLWCSVQKVRERKSRMIMEPLAAGWREPALCIRCDPPEDGNPFAIYGQVWGAERLLPNAIKQHRPFWYIDNGYWRPGRGFPDGYYRICYRGMSPVMLPHADPSRARTMNVHMARWRRSGRHILLALPGRDFGVALGLNMEFWIAGMRLLLGRMTDRPIIVRDRWSSVPLASELKDCWAVVTHSSNVAVDAVVAGIPVFVDPMAAASPVGNCDLDQLENPSMPDRDEWWRSLMCQQFTPAEMSRGIAYDYLAVVREQIDGRMAA